MAADAPSGEWGSIFDFVPGYSILRHVQRRLEPATVAQHILLADLPVAAFFTHPKATLEAREDEQAKEGARDQQPNRFGYWVSTYPTHASASNSACANTVSVASSRRLGG